MGVVGVGSAGGVTRKRQPRISKLTSDPHSCFVNPLTAMAIINSSRAAGEEKK